MWRSNSSCAHRVLEGHEDWCECVAVVDRSRNSIYPDEVLFSGGADGKVIDSYV